MEPKVSEISPGHIKILYAAYKYGLFGGVLKEDMKLRAFEDGFAEYLNDRWDSAVILETNNPIPPVGLMLMGISDHRMFPHVIWFPHARARDKVAAVLKFILKYKDDYGIFIPALEADDRFFKHMTRYRVLRRIGPLNNWYKGERTVLFESK